MGNAPQFKTKAAQKEMSDIDKYMSAAGHKSPQERKESRQRGLKNALAIGGSALGAYQAARGLGSSGAVIPEVLPPEYGPTNPMQIEGKQQPQLEYAPGMEKGPQGPNQFQMMPGAPIQPPQQMMQQAKQPGIAPTAPPMQTLAPQAPMVPAIDAKAQLQNMGFLDKASAMLQAGNAPEIVSGSLIAQAPKHLKAEFKKPEKQKEVQDAVAQYAQELAQGKANGQVNELQGQIRPAEGQAAPTELQLGNTGEEASQAPKAEDRKVKERGDVVSLPDGEIGTVEDIKKDHAVVEVNGKKKPVKLDQIEDLPIPQKDLADLHKDLIAGIEKDTGEEVSRAVMWAGYDPINNKLQYLPWDADMYTYDNIEPEYAERLTNLLTQRKTSGSSLIGSWTAGTKSVMGAQMHQIIKELQEKRGGKGKEYSGKAKAIYSAYEPGIKAAKKKKKEQENEEKRRKKEQR